MTIPHIYDGRFMAYTGDSSRHAATAVASLLRRSLDIDSVLDVGCAVGTWLAAWRDDGAAEIQGIDGDYVDHSGLQIAQAQFRPVDLAEGFDLGRRYDLVQSLEVAEHLPAAAADRFVGDLVAHSRGLVLFSAAPPGQGGEHHVNEQPYEYWRARFAAHGYRPFDALRPRLAGDRQVSFWYRYNMLLYVRNDRAATLPGEIAATAIADDAPIGDVSPWPFRLRKRLVRALPPSWRHGLARFKARLASEGRGPTRRPADR